MSTYRVLVTGAAGQIGYSLVLQIANGGLFHDKHHVNLVLYDIPPMKDALDGVAMELQDCALPMLKSVETVIVEEDAFRDVDFAFLVGAMPRKEGMERKDLLTANVKIFKSQGLALGKYAKPTCKVLVVGNPANTNALVCSKYASPKIPTSNVTAMTRLDHNRAQAMIAKRLGVPVGDVKNVIVWGNHSATQFPDVRHANVVKDGRQLDVYEAVKDDAWLQGDFISKIQKRGAEIIKMRKLSSAMSAAKAAVDHMHDWHFGTKKDSWVSMSIMSDGSYGIPANVVYSFPVHVDASTGAWKIVQGLDINDFARDKMTKTLKELEEERDEAFKACA